MLDLYWVEALDRLRGSANKIGPPIPKETAEEVKQYALRNLKRKTGQDFGFDIEAWEKFLIENPDIYEERLKRGEIPGATYSQEDYDNHTI
jgi:hypothetical protein